MDYWKIRHLSSSPKRVSICLAGKSFHRRGRLCVLPRAPAPSRSPLLLFWLHAAARCRCLCPAAPSLSLLSLILITRLPTCYSLSHDFTYIAASLTHHGIPYLAVSSAGSFPLSPTALTGTLFPSSSSTAAPPHPRHPLARTAVCRPPSLTLHIAPPIAFHHLLLDFTNPRRARHAQTQLESVP